MKKKLFVLLSSLFLAVFAFGQESHDSIREFKTFYSVYVTNVNWYFSTFEYPAQMLLSDEGVMIEARATVTYKYDMKAQRYDGLALTLRFLPLDSDKFEAGLRDSIRMYARQSTVVLNMGEAKSGAEYSIKSKADMYSRAFCMEVEVEKSKITVEYEMTFNPQKPENNEIRYFLRKADWEESDKAVPATCGFRATNNIINWRPRLHDVRYRHCEDDGKCHMSYIVPFFDVISGVRMNDSDRLYENICVNTFTFLQYICVGDGASDFHTSERNYDNLLLGSLYVGSKNPDKINVDSEMPLFYDKRFEKRLPYMREDKDLYYRYRAGAERFALGQESFIRQSSYSLLFYYKDK